MEPKAYRLSENAKENRVRRVSSLSSPRPDKRPKADLRHETTAWRLIQWAYVDECVRAATNQPSEADRWLKDPGGNSFRDGSPVGRGTINGLLEAHEDAFTVDAIISKCFSDRGGWESLYIRMIKGFERRQPVYETIDIPPLRFLQKCDERGRPEYIYPIRGKHEPILCLITVEGYSPEQAAVMLKQHQICWLAFCDALQRLLDVNFTKWKVVPG